MRVLKQNENSALVGALLVGATLLTAGSARADEPVQVLFGYGQLYQTRQDVESVSHLGTIGGVGRFGDDLFGTFDFQFGLDEDYVDLSHLSLSIMVGYALGPDAFTFWIGGGLRFGMDGYPNPSASLYDPGLGIGIMSNLGVVGIGADVRGWAGWNWYCDRRTEEIAMSFDPYLEWRLYLSVGL